MTDNKLKWQAVESSHIAALAYDKQNREAWVRFRSGATGRYTEFPRVKFKEWLAAPSKGAFCNSRVIPNHPWVAGSTLDKQPVIRKASPAVTSGGGGTGLQAGFSLQATLKAAANNLARMNGTDKNLLYVLWAVCGKGEKGSPPYQRYEKCLELIAEVSGCNQVSIKFLSAAAALAQRKGL